MHCGSQRHITPQTNQELTGSPNPGVGEVHAEKNWFALTEACPGSTFSHLEATHTAATVHFLWTSFPIK